MRFKEFCKLIAVTGVYSIRNIFEGTARYFVVFPFLFGFVVLFDKQTRSFFKISIRDKIDYYTVVSVFLVGEYSSSCFVHHEKMIKRYRKSKCKAVVLDAGAHIGCSSIFFARQFPDAKIYAIEPEVGNLNMLNRNTSTYNNIIVIEGGLSCKGSMGKIVDHKCESNSVRIKLSNTSASIPLYSVMEIFELDKVELILAKIDVEGFEHEIFSDATDWVEQTECVVIELHDWLFPNERSSGNFLQTIAGLERDFLVGKNVVFSFNNKNV